MAGKINTSAVLNNGWNSGGQDQVFTGPITIHPKMEGIYDFALTSDPVLLQEKQRTQEKIFEIFKKSPYFEKYGEFITQEDSESDEPKYSKTPKLKIERADIMGLFYYFKEELEKIHKIGIMELVIQICEFFELDYKYVNDHVLSPPLQAKLVREIYNMGYNKEKIENTEQLF